MYAEAYDLTLLFIYLFNIVHITNRLNKYHNIDDKTARNYRLQITSMLMLLEQTATEGERLQFGDISWQFY